MLQLSHYHLSKEVRNKCFNSIRPHVRNSFIMQMNTDYRYYIEGRMFPLFTHSNPFTRK